MTGESFTIPKRESFRFHIHHRGQYDKKRKTIIGHRPTQTHTDLLSRLRTCLRRVNFADRKERSLRDASFEA